MKRLLCIVSGMNAGGAETFLMKVYRNIDKSKYQMDFCVTEEENLYEKEICSYGGRLYHIPPKFRKPLKSFLSIVRIVKENEYKNVIRVNQHSLAAIDLLAAKIGGANHLVMRSSNAASDSKLQNVLHHAFFALPRVIPNKKIAPSRLAAAYTFGKEAVAKDQVAILNNGLDIDSFKFSDTCRERYRKELNLDGKYVIGHVGRFEEQKNHKFLIDVFHHVQKQRKDAVLLLIGSGTLMDEMKEYCCKLGIEKKCVFAGLRRDVNQILSAMDLFVFPSLYEGMPNTVIEAQTNGLPCLVSDSITEEVAITDLVHRLSIGTGSQFWGEKVLDLSIHQTTSERQWYAEYMKTAGYSIEEVVERFIQLTF